MTNLNGFLRLPIMSLFFTLGAFIFALPTHAAVQDKELEIEVIPTGPTEAQANIATRLLLNSGPLKEKLKNIRYRILSIDSSSLLSRPIPATMIDQEKKISAKIYDYTNDRLLIATGRIENLEIEILQETVEQPLPTHEEFLDAVRIIKSDPRLGAAVRSGLLEPYQAMPILLDPVAGGGKRVLPVGLRPIELTSNQNFSGHNLSVSELTTYTHEVVAVDLSRERVEQFTRKSPPGSIATQRVCGPPSARQGATPVGSPGSAWIIVKQKNNPQPVWRMHVTRPAASGGRWGSGIELREIYYRGRLVLHRAHAPILNVDYINDVCGPFRDPVNLENSFEATGTPMTSGILKTLVEPKTIFETRVDSGSYQGVAVFEDSSQLVLMSELSAGWYRYVSEFRFYLDGTIKPIFKFDAVHNSCTCEAHNHHVYWRFDFDLDGPFNNSVQIERDGGWTDVTKESRFTRGAQAKSWRILNTVTKRGYTITPGQYDQITNDFGRGDAWVLKYNSGEVDDSRFVDPKRAEIGAFLTGEDLNGSTDLVFWYAGHILHAEDGLETPHVVGPTLKPF